MQDANNTEQPDDDSDNHQKCESKFNKCETLDEGTFAFMHWLNSEDKASLSSTDNPIVLLKFINDIHTILYDTNLHAEVEVEIIQGIPRCKYCKEDDCAHVGFAICVEQSYGHRRTGTEERIEDIIG
ncbi:MAG: hypothetical protein WA364_10555 [Candidatus Nitrosopolaris sp.]|jgi:hypothetical protein